MKTSLLLAACACLLAACATSQVASSPSPAQQAMASQPERFVVVTLHNQNAPTMPRAGSTVRAYEPPSGYALAPATRASAKAIATAYGLQEATAWPIGVLGVHCIVYELPASAARDDVIARLRRDPRVDSAQPFQSFSTLTSEPNDPYRGLQHNLDVMDVAGAHSLSRGEGVRVAIVDTGVDAGHPDLAGRIVRQQNFVDDGARNDVSDRHGTAVAGVIAAVENNQLGIIGIAPAARVYALRACWPMPQDDSRALCSTLTLAKAIAAAIDSHIEIVNLSLSGPADPLLARLVEVGLRRGMVFVGATPGAGALAPGAHGTFPTNVAGVIGVDASRAPASADSVLFAPGVDVLTLVPGGRYDFLSGSSLAAASVSGGIALLLARDRTLRAADARAILARSSRLVSLDKSGEKDAHGGRAASVDLCAAVAAVVRESSCAGVPSSGELDSLNR
jgi:subtilisin family serine protease